MRTQFGRMIATVLGTILFAQSVYPLDGSRCKTLTPKGFLLEKSTKVGKRLVHVHLPIVGISSCLDGEGPLVGVPNAYRNSDYRILVDQPKLLVVEVANSPVHNRTIVVGNSQWRQVALIYKDSPSVQQELAKIQKEIARSR